MSRKIQITDYQYYKKQHINNYKSIANEYKKTKGR